MRQLFLFFAISILLVGCEATINPVETVAPPSNSATTQTSCQPSPIQKSENNFPEIQGTMKSGGEMWALLFFDTAYANEDEKIVWRITGSGEEFHAQAQNENGKVILPIWGPDYHGGSTWERPGQEWGTGFNFPESGCWKITVTRGATAGEITLDVLNP